VGVGVRVKKGVLVGVTVGVIVGVTLMVGVLVGVGVRVNPGVFVIVGVGVTVGVLVGDTVGVGVGVMGTTSMKNLAVTELYSAVGLEIVSIAILPKLLPYMKLPMRKPGPLTYEKYVPGPVVSVKYVAVALACIQLPICTAVGQLIVMSGVANTGASSGTMVNPLLINEA